MRDAGVATERREAVIDGLIVLVVTCAGVVFETDDGPHSRWFVAAGCIASEVEGVRARRELGSSLGRWLPDLLPGFRGQLAGKLPRLKKLSCRQEQYCGIIVVYDDLYPVYPVKS